MKEEEPWGGWTCEGWRRFMTELDTHDWLILKCCLSVLSWERDTRRNSCAKTAPSVVQYTCVKPGQSNMNP